MDGLLHVLWAAPLGAAAALLWQLRAERRRRRAWSEAAKDLGLRLELADSRATMVGGLDGVDVHAELTSDRTARFRARVPHLPPTFRARWKVDAQPQGVLLSDPEFDRYVLVEGPPTAIEAILDESARIKLLRTLREHDARVEAGAVWIERPGRLRDAGHLAAVARAASALARALSVPEELYPARLLVGARSETLLEVRRRKLRTLLREFAGEPEAAEALAQALASPDRATALLAARIADDREHLWRLVMDPEALAPLRREALLCLAGREDDRTLQAQLGAVLEGHDPQLTIWALSFFAERGLETVVPAAIRILEPRSSGAVAAAAAAALGRFDRTDAAAALVRAVERSRDEALLVAAAEGLGDNGGRAQLAALRALAGSAESRLVRAAAERAAARVVARLESAATGGLSVVAADGGELAVAGTGGELSAGDD